jgi:hypothetical protein
MEVQHVFGQPGLSGDPRPPRERRTRPVPEEEA